MSYPVKYAKKEVKEPNGNYSLFVPKDWEAKFEYTQYNNSEVIVFQAISIVKENGNFSGISIVETLTDKKDLKSQFDFFLDKYNNSFFSVLDSGKTNIFDTNSYFIQTEVANAESFDFIVESGKENIFYLINISTPKGKNQKHKMSMMLSCLKTFKILNPNS